ncbi:MAG: IS630 family transposase ISNpu2 [Chroococcidiopsis sp. SAG 2025]|uniref:IS630 family transposase n=1 Tax=Chroococcidiopsis sp. SAG 2025 TaxID=171389 RepID=UPI00293706AF|nr:IS630 family transposase [Chroococcidiopsis sp. SAG 2025]MDV2996795.1 IS630 family transposase ISNpu2 [Chroococcidiopsis sp. SAG 2025]
MPPPAKNFLTPSQVIQLQQALKESELPHVRERILIILLQNDGKPQHEIAKFLGCSPRTVAYWCMHGDPDNLESLHNKREYEHYRKATSEYIELLLKTVEQPPSELGYEFGRWTAERLATYLTEQTGIELSSSQVRRILKRKKYSYIWAKSDLGDKQDPKEREEFQERLRKYLAVARDYPDLLQVWFWDESGFSLRVIRRKNWGRKGQRQKVLGQRRRGRINVMGAIRESDRKRGCFFIEKGNADIFLEQLQQLNEFIKQEWANQGNCAEDFQSQGPRIILILDNASFHKRQDILSRVSQELPNFRLEFLPAYSPDYNIIELVWHSCKEYIAHRLFQSVDELKQLLERLLNQGELVIKWYRQIKNKGNNYYIAA